MELESIFKLDNGWFSARLVPKVPLTGDRAEKPGIRVYTSLIVKLALALFGGLQSKIVKQKIDGKEFWVNRLSVQAFANRTLPKEGKTQAVQLSKNLELYFVQKWVARVKDSIKTNRLIEENSDSELKTPKIEVNIPAPVKEVLDKLFEGSPYSLDNLPVFPKISDGFPSYEEMTHPVMKGKAQKDSREDKPFIAIQLECTLTDEYLEKRNDVKKYLADDRNLKRVYSLFQYRGDLPLMWDVNRWGDSTIPAFIDWNFTDHEDGSGPTQSQVKGFAKVNELLRTGQAVDSNGILWKIPGRN